MGYYDGLGGTETSASSWEIAEITDTPAILVLDCKGASLSAAAMASGFLHFRKKSHIAGVILNRVSSMYYERLAAAVEEASGLPVLGYLPESEEYRMESRHLGLFLPGEIDRLRERIGRLADQMEKSIAVERVLEVAGMLPLRVENKEKEKAENAERSQVIISVCDLGNGIPDDRKERVFDMFYTGSDQVADSRRSLGLGLGLCRSIINAHGGKIWISDNIPHGAVVTFTLPAEEVALNE